MISNFLLLFSFYFFIMFSAIGYGSFFYRDKLDDILINFGFKGLVGFFVLIVYSYLSHFFIHIVFYTIQLFYH